LRISQFYFFIPSINTIFKVIIATKAISTTFITVNK
jgi:hypothetical protein